MQTSGRPIRAIERPDLAGNASCSWRLPWGGEQRSRVLSSPCCGKGRVRSINGGTALPTFVARWQPARRPQPAVAPPQAPLPRGGTLVLPLFLLRRARAVTRAPAPPARRGAAPKRAALIHQNGIRQTVDSSRDRPSRPTSGDLDALDDHRG